MLALVKNHQGSKEGVWYATKNHKDTIENLKDADDKVLMKPNSNTKRLFFGIRNFLISIICQKFFFFFNHYHFVSKVIVCMIMVVLLHIVPTVFNQNI